MGCGWWSGKAAFHENGWSIGSGARGRHKEGFLIFTATIIYDSFMGWTAQMRKEREGRSGLALWAAPQLHLLGVWLLFWVWFITSR